MERRDPTRWFRWRGNSSFAAKSIHTSAICEGDFSSHTAFLIAARVFRGGGFAKDAIYLRGFKTVLDMLAAGQALDPFWYGKIDTRHFGVVAELAERGILHKPALVPEFLAAPDVTARIAAFRHHPSYSSLL